MYTGVHVAYMCIPGTYSVGPTRYKYQALLVLLHSCNKKRAKSWLYYQYLVPGIVDLGPIGLELTTNCRANILIFEEP